MRKILCPVDFSEFSQRAFGYAACLAKRFGARLILQHTVEPAQYVFLGMAPEAVRPSPEKQLQTAREAVREMLAASQIDASSVTVLLNQGNVSARIFQAIANEPIDLVVMGTHGRKGFNHLLLGSVTEGIVHQATCPVLTVSRPRRTLSASCPDGMDLRTILLATDFSPHSDRAAAYAMKWACDWGARVVILHVVRETSSLHGMLDLMPEYNPAFQRQISGAWKRTRHLLPEPAQASCETRFEVRAGNPLEEILRVAQETWADLIITGARGIGGSSMLWGSVSAGLVRDGRTPVLVVRELASVF